MFVYNLNFGGVLKYFVFPFLVLVTLTSISFNCSENTLDSTDLLPPGRRDYLWTVDTLFIPFTVLQRIWGSSPTDVWAIGPGGDADKTIYHFDGTGWKNDGISRPLAPTSIWGSAPDNIWIGSGGGDIWRFDGVNWLKNSTLILEGYNYISLENIWGDSPDNVYVVGFAENTETFTSIIAKFDGNQWKLMDATKNSNSFIKIKRGIKTSNNYFVMGLRIEQFYADTSYLYEFDGSNLNLIYQGFANNDELGEFEVINNEMIFLRGYEICKYSGNKFQAIYTITNPNFDNGMWGRNLNDLFFSMKNGIAHYNGSNLEYIYNFEEGIRLTGGMIFEDEVFFLAYDYNNGLNLVFRGKLK